MSTKRLLAEQVQKILTPRVTTDAKIDIRQCELAVAQVRDNIAYTFLTAAAYQDELDLFGGFVSSPDEYTIQKGDDGNYFVQLTSTPLDLPKNMGVYAVYGKEDMSTQYLPVGINFTAMFKESEARDNEGNPAFALHADKLIFHGDVTEGTGLYVVMVKSGFDIPSRGFFPIPPSYEREVVRGALEMLAPEKQIPEDLINDGIDN